MPLGSPPPGIEEIGSQLSGRSTDLTRADLVSSLIRNAIWVIPSSLAVFRLITGSMSYALAV